MKKSIWILGSALVTILSLSCAAMRSAVQTKPQAGASASFSFVMDLECTEMAASFPINATLARRLVPLEYELELQADGSAPRTTSSSQRENGLE